MPNVSIPALDEVIYLAPDETLLNGLYKAG